MASNMETHTRLNPKCNPTIAVFFLPSWDGSYTWVANRKHWVCCCKPSKSSAPAPIRKEDTGCFIARKKHQAGILTTDQSSKVFCHVGSIQADFWAPLPWLVRFSCLESIKRWKFNSSTFHWCRLEKNKWALAEHQTGEDMSHGWCESIAFSDSWEANRNAEE